MALTINTNVSSLNAQRNLAKSQGDLSTAMQRLSSGLRINSAKDDAAGLAISDRMTAQIRGLNQAARNANDGISMAQTAEGALQETTNILQRMRELAIQSANDTNSAPDRASLQAEINQLQQEMTRIATSTSFNNRNVLDGTLYNAQFQVGANANETITFSIPSAKADDLGINSLKSTATPAASVPATTVTTFALSASAAADTIAAGNNIGDQTIRLTNSVTGNFADLAVTANMSAADIAAKVTPSVTAQTGWTATATTTAVFQTLLNDGSVSFKLYGSVGSATIPATAVTTADLSALNSAINLVSSSTGITSTVSSGVLTLTDASGGDIKLENFLNTNGGTVSMGGVSLTSGPGTDSVTIGGTVTFTGPGAAGATNGAGTGATIASTSTPATSPLGIETATTAAANTSNGNNVNAQILTIVGPNSTQTVDVELNDSAQLIAHKVNLETILTGVKAEARTTATISDLKNDGTISFSIEGNNTTPIDISATVTSEDLTALASTLNEKSGTTGILATLSGDKKSITLVQSVGYDIKIANYRHSSDLATDTITIKGNEGAGINLRGDSAAGNTFDSTVVGGEVSFYSTGSFNVQSTVGGGLGSIFNSAASVANASQLSTVDTVDISTITGATEGIKSIDGAISQIDALRGLLGAIQNRFESTISNLQNVSENLSAARSRILDADIAQETSNMTKNNILQQAGVSILTQANQTPQLALQLLQG